MFLKISKDIMSVNSLTNNEMIFPVVIFISKYQSLFGELKTTLKCIADESYINPTGKNIEKIKSCLDELNELGYIKYNPLDINMNTPILINNLIDTKQFFVIYDFEIDEIINLVKQNKISYKLASVFMTLKYKSFNGDINKNEYECDKASYAYISRFTGVISYSTIKTYLKLLKECRLIEIQSTKEENEKLIMLNDKDSLISNRYIFRKI